MPVRAAIAGVLLLAAALYLKDLDKAPVYIGWDEARFALQGYAIATTGHDLNGHAMPLFFHNTDPLVPNNTSPIWWQPFLIYLTAAVLRVTTISEWSTRAPVVGLALLDILLIAAVARQMFGSRWHGVLAAFLLALAPATDNRRRQRCQSPHGSRIAHANAKTPARRVAHIHSDPPEKNRNEGLK